MLRIIIRTEHNGAACHVQGAVSEHEFKTFDIDLPEIEKYLREFEKRPNSYSTREVIGIEKF